MRETASLLAALAILFVSAGAAALPRILTDCKSDDDCTVVQATCIEPVAANRRYAGDLQSEFTALSAATDCEVGLHFDVAAQKTHCSSGWCELVTSDKPVASRPKCLQYPAIDLTGDPELDLAISELRIPIASTQRRGLMGLAKQGSAAKVSLPLITAIWNQAYDDNYHAVSECYVGWGDVRVDVIAALKPFCAEVPLPRFIIDCYRSKCLYQISREELMWDLLVACGAQAEPLVPDVVRSLETTASGQGFRGEMIAVLRNIPSQKMLSSAVLKKIAQSKTDFQNTAALQALDALGVASLDDDLILSILNDPQESAERVISVVKLLPHGCIARERCVQALRSTCTSASITVRYESVRALGRFGSDGFAAADTILKLYFDMSSDFAADSIASLRAIDPVGERIIPLVRPQLEDPYNVRKAVLLLEQLSGEEAQSLARETRIRWKL